MKKITIPAGVEFKGTKLVDGKEVEEVQPYSFADFVRHLLDTDPRFCDTASHVRANVRLDNALWKAAVGTVVELENDDAKLLAEVAEQPQKGYPTFTLPWGHGFVKQTPISRLLLPFLDAIAEAAK